MDPVLPAFDGGLHYPTEEEIAASDHSAYQQTPAGTGQMLPEDQIGATQIPTSMLPTNNPLYDSLAIQPELAEAEASDQVDQLADAIVTMEGYRSLIRQAGHDGISGQSAAMMRIGLERIEKLIGTTSMMAALEDFAVDKIDNRSNKSAVNVDQGKSDSMLKKIIDQLKAWINKLIEEGKKLWDRLTDKKERLKENIAQTRESVKTSKGPNGPKGQRRIVPFQKVARFTCIKGKFDGDLTSLENLIAFVNKGYPEAVTRAIEASADGSEARIDFRFNLNTILPGNWRLDQDGVALVLAYEDDDSVEPECPVRDNAAINKTLNEVEKLLGKLQWDGEPIEKAIVQLLDGFGEKVEVVDDNGQPVDYSGSAAAITKFKPAIEANRKLYAYIMQVLTAYVLYCQQEIN
jgi:hypothetical protein